MVKCSVCGMEFNTQEEHDKHHQEAHGGSEMKCPMCGYMAKSKEDMENHSKTHKGGQM